MSNIGYNNKAWARSNTSPNVLNQNSLQPQLMNQSSLGNIGTGMVQFQQQHQVFQSAMNMQQQNLGLGLQQMASNLSAATLNSQIASNPIFQQVTYPNTRGLNATAFQTNIPTVPSIQNNSSSGTKQRVFTGKVTQMHDNFGLVDDEVIFQTNVCVKGSNPSVGDRVLVEASYTPNMHFKWSATRIQVLMNQTTSRHTNSSKGYGSSSTYSAVPPPDNSNSHFGRSGRKGLGGRGRERSRERDRDDDEIDRKRRREERLREREKEDKKSPVRRRSRTRSRSPKSRRRSRIVPRYMVQIPKITLDLSAGDVLEMRSRYTNLYIPSDFFFTNIKWVDSFPPDKPFALNKPCSFHIMNKEVDLITEEVKVEPTDSDYVFSAKVMLMSVPGLEELYQKCCAMAEHKDRRDRDSEEKDFVHPTRLINFLVGLRGKNETMAIGGPWSPSLDGENPEKDPSVLIRTAIRTCKSLTGIDLSNCTQWYRFVELYYRRNETTHKGKTVPARVETVVLFLPDVWSCLPTRLEWDNLQQAYKKRLECNLNVEQEANDDASTADEKEEETQSDKLEPTPYSELDPKTMMVNDLRNELKARNISSKGLKSQLIARLTKALKAEAEKSEDDEENDKEEASEADAFQDEKKSEVEEKKLDEKEKAILERRYTLPDQQHILVHPSKTAKAGKFDCTVMSLSLLLDYRPEDTKEHSFEVSLFAELFNEMLIRDFGFNIFKALYELPEKEKDKDEKKDDIKKDDKKEKDDKKDKKDKEIKKEKVDKKKKVDAKKSDDTKKEVKDEDKKKMEEKKKDGEKDEEKMDVDEKLDKDKKGKEGEKKDAKDDKKRVLRKEDDSEEDDDDAEEEDSKDRKKSKDKKKKDRLKLYTKHKHLLLSFVYFDQTHCGYIFDKDIEDLLYTLGLKLSRAQVRKLVSKVVSRDSLHYRKLTDKPKDEDLIVIDDAEVDTGLNELAFGNKKLLPIFSGDTVDSGKNRGETGAELEEGFVMFRGSLVDVSRLMSQLDRSEKARIDTETRMVELKNENNKLLDKYSKSNSTIKHLNSEVKDYKEKLRHSEECLGKTAAHSKLFQATLVDILDKIEPVLKSTSHKEELSSVKKEKEEKDKDKKHDEGKSRWEKDNKKDEIADEEMVSIKKDKD